MYIYIDIFIICSTYFHENKKSKNLNLKTNQTHNKKSNNTKQIIKINTNHSTYLYKYQYKLFITGRSLWKGGN